MTARKSLDSYSPLYIAAWIKAVNEPVEVSFNTKGEAYAHRNHFYRVRDLMKVEKPLLYKIAQKAQIQFIERTNRKGSVEYVLVLSPTAPAIESALNRAGVTKEDLLHAARIEHEARQKLYNEAVDTPETNPLAPKPELVEAFRKRQESYVENKPFDFTASLRDLITEDSDGDGDGDDNTDTDDTAIDTTEPNKPTATEEPKGDLNDF